MRKPSAGSNSRSNVRPRRVPVYYAPPYVAAGYAFDTTRKSGAIHASLITEPIAGVELREPSPVDAALLGRIHDAAYVDAVRTGQPQWLAESQGFAWDPGLWLAACAHVGGMLAAAQAARETGCAGSLSSGQHHARHATGEGFCTFNGVALAAIEVASRAGVNVVTIDTDAHCGGGTWSLIERNPRVRQLDLAVSAFDSYEPDDGSTLDIVHDPDRYLPTLRQRLTGLANCGLRFGLCVYYAGMDPFERCSPGGLSGIDLDLLAARERMVFAWCHEQDIPVAFGLGGGYAGPRLTAEEVVGLHRLTLRAATWR